MDRKKTLIKIGLGSIFYTLSNISSRLMGLFSLIILSRALGPVKYGFIPLALSILNLTSNVSDLGISVSMSRFLAEKGKKEEAKRILLAGFLLKAITLFILTGVFLLLIPFFSKLINLKEIEPLLKSGILYILGFSFFTYHMSVFRAFKDFNLMSIFESLRGITTFVCIIFFVYFISKNPSAVIWGYIIPQFSFALFGFIPYKKLYISKINIQINEFYKIIRYSFPLFLIIISYIFYNSIDIIMLGKFTSTEEVSFYSLPKRIIEYLWFPASSFGIILSPYYAKNDEILHNLNTYKKILFLVFIIYFPLVILLMVFSNPIVLLLFGNEYLSSGKTLSFLSLSLIWFPTGIVIGHILDFKGKAFIRSLWFVFNAFFLFILYIILIPKFRAQGAAIAFLISSFIYSSGLIIYSILVFKKQTKT